MKLEKALEARDIINLRLDMINKLSYFKNLKQNKIVSVIRIGNREHLEEVGSPELKYEIFNEEMAVRFYSDIIEHIEKQVKEVESKIELL